MASPRQVKIGDLHAIENLFDLLVIDILRDEALIVLLLEGF
jgi:hypothetical protein